MSELDLHPCDNIRDDVPISCRDMLQLTKILINHDARRFPKFIFYRRSDKHDKICQYCICARKHLIYYLRDFIENIQHINFVDEFSAAMLLNLLKMGRIVCPSILNNYMQIDRAISLMLLENGAIYFDTCQFITVNEVRAKYVKGEMRQIEIELDSVYPNIYTFETLDMLLAELRRPDLTRADLIRRYSGMSDILTHYDSELCGPYKNAFIELFPLFVFNGNNEIIEARDDDAQQMTADICSIDLIDRVMSYSDCPNYVAAVKSQLTDFIDAINVEDYKNAVARLIITRHPQYLRHILLDPQDIDGQNIFKASIKLSEYGPQLIFDNIRHDFTLLDYIRHRKDEHISAADMNLLIEQVCYHSSPYVYDIDNLNYARSETDYSTSNLYDIYDLIAINNNISVESITPEIMSAFINQITSSEDLQLRTVRVDIDGILSIPTEYTLRYITDLINKTPRVLDIITIYSFMELLPVIHNNFWCRFRAIHQMCARRGLPDDVRDLMLIYYIRPSADNDEIVQMLSLQRES
jgi:hypothetical protein